MAVNVTATGIRQARGAVKGGLFITVIVSGIFHAIDQLLDDQLTWHHFVGRMAVDVALAVAATGITLGITSLVTTGAVIAATGPLVIVILVGVFMVFAFTYLVDAKSLSKKTVAMLLASDEKFHNNMHRVQREFIAVDDLAEKDIESFLRHITNIPHIEFDPNRQ